MKIVFQDLRYALRLTAKKPGFTAVVVLVLALGIGANAAIFSVVNTVLFQPLPYADAERLMRVWEVIPGVPQNTVAPPNFIDWREQNQTFEGMAAYVEQALTLTGDGEPEKVEGVYSSDNLFDVLGVPPTVGRTFRGGETRGGDISVAVLSYGLWQRRFGGDPEVVGQKIIVDGIPLTVGAVMPQTFTFPSRAADLWLGTTMTPTGKDRNSAHYLHVIGRLQPGLTREQAQADLDAIAARLREQYPQTNRDIGVWVNPLREQQVGDIRPALLILFAAAAFVLLIACVNIANLLLARGAARQKEIAIRLALGAGRARIVRQLFTEGLLLAVLGGAAGLLVALWGVSALVSFMPEDLVPYYSVAIDRRVLVFTIFLSLLTTFIFGLFPALQATNSRLGETLQEGGRGAGSGSPGKVRGALVVAEVALSLALLIGAGLMINSFIRLNRVDPGFRAENLLTLEVFPPYSKYPDVFQRTAFYDDMLRRVQSLPGVESASVVTAVPLQGGLGEMLYFAERQPQMQPFKAVPRVIGGDYFRTMGIAVIGGRTFDAQDRPGNPHAAVINEAVARLYWAGEDPIGKRLKQGMVTSDWLTVVGVVGDTKLRFEDAAQPQVYLPYSQYPSFAPQHLVVRATADPLSLVTAVRGEIRAVDKDQPVANVQTMEAIISDHVSRQRFNAQLLAVFAALALALATVGLYGVLSYLVTQNTREIGIRVALGATRPDILKLIVSQGLLMALIGVGLGLAGALWLTRLMSKLLYEVTANDPLTFAAAAALLIAITLLASYVPARRATKIDPMVALRYE